MKKLFRILFCILLSFLTSGIAGLFMNLDTDQWFKSLNAPPLLPPGWVFGVVWPILYLLMGLAAGLIINEGMDKKPIKVAFSAYLLQLILNGMWPMIFAYQRCIGVALAEIILLWATIILCTILYSQISKIAAILMVPYVLWITFAIYLNAGFWLLNR